MCSTFFQRSMSEIASASSADRSASDVASMSSMNAFTSPARSRTGSHALFKLLSLVKSCFASFWLFQNPSLWLCFSSSAISFGMPRRSKRVLPRVQRGLQFPNLIEESFHGGGGNIEVLYQICSSLTSQRNFVVETIQKACQPKQ